MINIFFSDFHRSFKAEQNKLKRTPLLWISLLGGIFVAVLIFLLFFFNVEEMAQSTAEPWPRYLGLSVGIVAMLLLVPYAILLTGAIVYPEHQGGMWKHLFSLPLPRGQFYFGKLAIVLCLLLLTFLIFFAALLLGGILLGYLRPIYGFQDSALPAGQLLWVLGHTFLSLLGVVALQYWLAIRSKSFIAPVGIGLGGFILAFIAVKKSKLALLFPYCYPMFRALLSTETTVEESGLRVFAGLVEFEWYSLICFLLFTLLGWMEVNRRDVK